MATYTAHPIDLVARCYTYMVMGFLICVANVFAGAFFSLLMKNWRVYFLFIMLCGVELVNGIQYIVTGGGRLILIRQNKLNTPISSMDCLLFRPWVLLNLLGAQLPASLHTCLAIERVLAIHWSVSYAQMKKFGVKVRLTILSFVVVTMATTTAVIIVILTPMMQPDQQCMLLVIGDGWYGTIQYIVIALLYVFDLIIMVWVLFVLDKRTKPNRDERRRHVIVMWMSLVSVLAISLPSFATFIYHFGIEVPEFVTVLVFVAPGVPPTLNPLLYFLSIPSYRRKLEALFCTSSEESVRDRVINVASTQGSMTGRSFAQRMTSIGGSSRTHEKTSNCKLA